MDKIVFMSIRPEYAEKILTGEKKVELRKRFPQDLPSGTKVLIYASSPVQRVVGEFLIKKIEICSIQELFERTEKLSCVDKKFYDSYFANKILGAGIFIQEPTRYLESRPLSDYGIKRPPQSYCYI